MNPTMSLRLLHRTVAPALRTQHTRRALWTTSRRHTRSQQPGTPSPDAEPKQELEVGELEGITFKVEPLRRTGEDDSTMRARLVYQSRKRGTLESDLLLSTFAAKHLPTMSRALMTQYDLLMDENDWDIYYWATQEPPSDTETSPASTQKKDEAPAWMKNPRNGEWAQTVGTFKAAYRPVPERWRDSEILVLLRGHVKERSGKEGKEGGTGGLGFMPSLYQK